MKTSIVDKLKTEGWQEQFTASGDRLDEAVDIYRRLGFEVTTISVNALDREGCNVCMGDENDTTMMIFTKKNGNSDRDYILN
jgi:hypothetical protein